MMQNGESTFIDLCDNFIKTYGLGYNDKIGIIPDNNIGDTYYMFSVLPYVEKFYNKSFYIIIKRNGIAHKLLDLFVNAGVEYRIIFCDCDIAKLSNKYRLLLADRYKNYIQYIYYTSYDLLLSYKNSLSEVKKLIRPKYQSYSNYCFSEKYGLHQGNTVFIIPDSTFNNRLSDIFWKTVINLYSLLGFNIAVNSRIDLKFGNGVTYVYPEINEIVPFSNYCGIIFAMRTGLSEIIAAESDAKIVIVNSLYPIETVYTFIPQGKIKYFPIKNIRGTGLPLIDQYINTLLNNATSPIAVLFSDLKRSDLHWYPAKLISQKFANTDKPFEFTYLHMIQEHFCSINYAIDLQSGVILLFLNIEPSQNYDIYCVLYNDSMKSVEKKVDKSTTNPIAICIEKSANYKIFVKVYHPWNNKFCHFFTKRFKVTLDPVTELKKCSNYFQYIKLLSSIKNDLIIFISSRDAHTNPQGTKCLNLESLGLTLEAYKKFRNSYLAVIDAGVVIEEQLSSNKLIEFEYSWNNNTCIIQSAGYNVYNNDRTAISIKINDIEQALNGRGLNFVIWDKLQNKVIDSVAFDTFQDSNPAVRLNTLYSIL